MDDHAVNTDYYGYGLCIDRLNTAHGGREALFLILQFLFFVLSSLSSKEAS
jgi:hypothetical protein